MAKNKNARYEQSDWVSVSSICHPSAKLVIHHSPAMAIYAVHCAECGKKLFQLILQSEPI